MLIKAYTSLLSLKNVIDNPRFVPCRFINVENYFKILRTLKFEFVLLHVKNFNTQQFLVNKIYSVNIKLFFFKK